MADEPDVQVEDTSLDDVSLIDNQIAPATDETPAEPAEQAKDDGAEQTDKVEPEATDKTDAKDAKAIEQPAQPEQTQAEQRQADKALAQREYQNRQRTRQAISQQIDQNYAPKSEADLVNEGMTPQEAQIQALREEMSFDKQRTQIAEMNAGLQSDAVNVQMDFSVFNSKSKDYDADFTKEVEEAYRVAARLTTDEQGIVTNAEIPLYDFYEKMNNIYNRGASKGTTVGQAEMAQMMSRTETVGGSSSTSKGGNSLEELEERLGNMVIT